MKKLIVVFLGAVTMLSANAGYKTPPQNIVKIFDQERNPYISFAPFQNFGLEVSYPLHQTLEQLAEPKVKLAGKDITKKLNASMNNYPTTSLNIFGLQDKQRIPIKFDSDVKIRNTAISIDYKKIAMLNEVENGIQLIVADIENGKCKYFKDFFINDIFNDGFTCWMNDNEHILLQLIPRDRGKEPEFSQIPSSPIMEETSGKKSTVRTYQNLLQNKNDEKLFDHYFTSQLALLNINTGKLTYIGKPAIYYDVEISPNNENLLIQTIQKPYSYQVPYYYFPRKFEIRNIKGKIVKELHQRGLQDAIPIGGTYTGPRYYRWQPLKDATLIWVEAQDEGNPKIEVTHRDKIFQLPFPFTAPKDEIFQTEHRYSNIIWSQKEDEMIFSEYDRDKLWLKSWFYKIGSEPKLITDISIKDEYNDPGELVMKETKRGKLVFLKNKNYVYYINNTGATPKGNFPFLSKVNLETNEKEILFRSGENFHDTIQTFAGNDLDKIIIRSENQNTPPNYFTVDLKTNFREKITEYPNNFEALTTLKKELVTYQRKDGIPLSGELYLPADYKKGDKLPLVINAYPEEYTDSSTAGQINSTPNRFIRFWGASIRYFVLQGYAVLTKASIPIVGNPQTVNETFIDQTISSVEAAINYLDERGIIDPNRVGITGHSYGAFMVANVLANSDLCAAGIAKSGAYNRTLTPFGFQSERRTFWEAKDFYIKVSPFAQAENIKEPILLIHGENDPNSGTYPMQSRRFYQAIKGNGGTARLVILPFEGHGYQARVSGLHTLAEMLEWFDKYVKNK